MSGPALESDPANSLSAGCGTKLTVAYKQRASLRYKHSTILASDHLRRPGFTRHCPGASGTRRREKPPHKADYEIRQDGIDDESKQHCYKRR